MKFRSSLMLCALLLGLAVAPLAAGESDDDSFRRISAKLVCQCGCNYGLLYCPHLECGSAIPMRQTIRDALAEGKTEEEVLQIMVAQFGPSALGEPPAEGFNLMAWIMPIVALLFGSWAVQRLVRSWRARAPAPAAASQAALVERYRGTIDREIEQLEE